jgi:hypothetical protein
VSGLLAAEQPSRAAGEHSLSESMTDDRSTVWSGLLDHITFSDAAAVGTVASAVRPSGEFNWNRQDAFSTYGWGRNLSLQ